ncbi:MAG TPA: hypothetical protein VN643_00260 [Pyrinomonadaceae bacterium]|nr:hypothetical protein [Pyrinomonadaceae bacterium]
MPKFSYRKRLFLAPVSTGHTSHIFAEAESTRGGVYKWGHYMLTIADCRRRVELEFFLGTARARRASLARIDLLIKHLDQFRTALPDEVGLIEQYDAKQKAKPQKSNKALRRRTVSGERINERTASASI